MSKPKLVINDDTSVSRLYVLPEAPTTLPEQAMIAYCRKDNKLYLSDTTSWRTVSTEEI